MTQKHIYQFGDFTLDPLERVLKSGGRPVSLAPKAIDVLIVLLENRGRIVEKEVLISKVWQETFVEDNNLTFNISVLRKILGESSAASHYIETVPKRGYRFLAEETLPPDSTASGDRLEANPDAEHLAVPPVKTAQTRTLMLALMALTAVAGLITYELRRAPKLTDKDTLVLADFSNTTADPVFDGTLSQGVAMELG